MSLMGLDEIFDEGHAIGFSNWGIASNIFQLGNNFSYYKFSHIWLGSLLELTDSSPLMVSSSVAIPVVSTVIGLALWALTFHVGKSSHAACVAPILLFCQYSLTEPLNIPLRLAQSLVLCYLIGSLVALSKVWTSKLVLSLITAFILFITFSTRAQYGLLLIMAIATAHLISVIQKKLSIRQITLFAIPSAISLSLSFYLFYTAPFLDYGAKLDVPIVANMLSGLGLRVFIPILLLGRFVLEKSNSLFNSILVISFVLMFGIDHQILGDSSLLTVIIVTTIFIAIKLSTLKISLTKFQILVFAVLGSLVGISLRLTYDLYKWRDPAMYTGIRKFINATAIQQERTVLFSLPPLFLIALILLFGYAEPAEVCYFVPCYL